MEYQVVTAESAKDLKTQVEKQIDEGWEPIGGVSVTGWCESWENSRKGNQEMDTYTIFAQAMVYKTK